MSESRDPNRPRAQDTTEPYWTKPTWVAPDEELFGLPDGLSFDLNPEAKQKMDELIKSVRSGYSDKVKALLEQPQAKAETPSPSSSSGSRLSQTRSAQPSPETLERTSNPKVNSKPDVSSSKPADDVRFTATHIFFPCPECNTPLRVSLKYVGQAGSCNHCSKRIIVPTVAN